VPSAQKCAHGTHRQGVREHAPPGFFLLKTGTKVQNLGGLIGIFLTYKNTNTSQTIKTRFVFPRHLMYTIGLWFLSTVYLWGDASYGDTNHSQLPGMETQFTVLGAWKTKEHYGYTQYISVLAPFETIKLIICSHIVFRLQESEPSKWGGCANGAS
jgi:hypothetical protein